MRSVVILASLIVYCIPLVTALEVNSCNNGEKGLDAIEQEIFIGRCKKFPCRFRKGTNPPAEFKFTPAVDTSTLISRVNAKIVGIPFPFIGVDGTDACKSIYREDGKTRVGCPLKKGETYIYKTEVEILSIYPSIRLEVHWSLEAESGDQVVCFEVPGRITN